MLVAMTEAVAERGFTRTTVADVISRARVSRETFYEQFSDKEDCFLAALDGAAGLLAGGMSDAFAAPADPFDRLDAGLGAYLETLASEPAAARTFLIEVYGAGDAAIARRITVMERFVDLVAGFTGARDPQARFRCEVLVGAVSSMVTMRVAAGDHASLPALREPLMALARELLDTEEAA
jgi:AcrR family transcriptional regulator